MKQLTILAISALIFLVLGCGKSSNSAGNAGGDTVSFTGSLTSPPSDSLLVYEWQGGMYVKIGAGVIGKEDGKLNFSVKIPQQGMYFLGATPQADPRNMKLVILSPGETLNVSGNAMAMGNVSVESPMNKIYGSYNIKTQQLNQRTQQLFGQYRQLAQTGGDPNSLMPSFQQLAQQKQLYMDSLKQSHPFIAKVAALQHFQTFFGNPKGYNNQAEHFAAEYFADADFSDEAYNHIPLLYDEFKNYAGNLAQVGLPNEAQLSYVDQALAKFPPNSLMLRHALQGLSDGFNGKNEGLFAYCAQKFVSQYGQAAPQMANAYASQIEAARALAIGAPAPEISLQTPDGKTMKLSDLKGKVVLVDFWASWCKPCRRENPNVKKVYAKYQSKGFEILGVSLDRSKEPWVKAIQDDGLPWFHVSDLKFWQSEAAKTYGIKSIPFTVLVDREGNIIDKNLRGAQLEQKLAQLFEG